MAARNLKGSVYLRVLLWIVIIVALFVAAMFSMVALVSVLGYQGTTSLHSMKEDSAQWQDFTNLFKSKKSAPFSWSESVPSIDAGIVKFDKRLVRELTYLSRKSDARCGWDGQHEKLALASIGITTSDLSFPSSNLPSGSTVGRGVGIRVAAADEVKCTIYPLTDECPYKQPTAFDHKLISLKQSDIMAADKSYPCSCEVTCAVDYYPMSPTGAPADQLVKPAVITELGNYDPGEFLYKTISENGKRAAVYKAAQLIYELVRTDDQYCENTSTNIGNKRNAPITIVAPQWIVGRLGDGWQSFIDLATDKLPYKLQTSSPLAGLSYDPLLNDIGLHFNY